MTVDQVGTLHTLFLASEEILMAWSERHIAAGEVMAIDEADPQRAIDLIVRRRPRVVVIEQRFAGTSRGQAFVHRLRHDPDLPPVEIRMLPAEHAATLASTHSPLLNSPASVVALAQPIVGPVRRAVRVPMPAGVQVQVDGRPASLVDLSTMGAQIVSAKTLKPNQKVRVQITDDSGVFRATAGVAWASFELPKGQTPRYRAGMQFNDADPETLQAFYSRLASSAPAKKQR